MRQPFWSRPQKVIQVGGQGRGRRRLYVESPVRNFSTNRTRYLDGRTNKRGQVCSVLRDRGEFRIGSYRRRSDVRRDIELSPPERYEGSNQGRRTAVVLRCCKGALTLQLSRDSG